MASFAPNLSGRRCVSLGASLIWYRTCVCLLGAWIWLRSRPIPLLKPHEPCPAAVSGPTFLAHRIGFARALFNPSPHAGRVGDLGSLARFFDPDLSSNRHVKEPVARRRSTLNIRRAKPLSKTVEQATSGKVLNPTARPSGREMAVAGVRRKMRVATPAVTDALEIQARRASEGGIGMGCNDPWEDPRRFHPRLRAGLVCRISRLSGCGRSLRLDLKAGRVGSLRVSNSVSPGRPPAATSGPRYPSGTGIP